MSVSSFKCYSLLSEYIAIVRATFRTTTDEGTFIGKGIFTKISFITGKEVFALISFISKLCHSSFPLTPPFSMNFALYVSIILGLCLG